MDIDSIGEATVRQIIRQGRESRSPVEEVLIDAQLAGGLHGVSAERVKDIYEKEGGPWVTDGSGKEKKQGKPGSDGLILPPDR